jgi:hypothetical protein
MKRYLPILALAALAQLGVTDCGKIIDDGGFDHWCGDQLCFWKVERGETRRVPTWHAGDDGVELVGDDVAISQLTPVTSADTDCIRFQMVTDIEETAEVHLEADVFGDGTVDWRERIPTARWERVTLRIGVAGPYDGIRFRITKAGSGRAVLARIYAETEDEGCPTYLELDDRPLGASCQVADDCASGICTAVNWVATACSACDDDADCVDGEVCGRTDQAPPHLEKWRTCVPEASRELGELCFGAAECTTGACNNLVCTECGDALACSDGATCAIRSEQLPVEMCGAAGGDRAGGEACLVDADCASGACDGEPLGFCDGATDLPCYAPEDCPSRPDLTPMACTVVGVAGGTCR